MYLIPLLLLSLYITLLGAHQLNGFMSMCCPVCVCTVFSHVVTLIIYLLVHSVILLGCFFTQALGSPLHKLVLGDLHHLINIVLFTKCNPS